MRGDNKEILQHGCNKNGDNVLQQRQSTDDHTLKHCKTENKKRMLQANKSNYEETHQQSNSGEGEEMLKHNRTDDIISKNKNRLEGLKKKRRMN